MLNKSILSGLVALSLSIIGSVNANDFVAKKSNSQVNDKGNQAILEAQNTPVEIVTEEFISAENQLSDYVLEKFGREGWDPKKQRIIAIHAEQWNTDDPGFDPEFASKRALYAAMSSMGARAKIAEFMRTQMSSKDMLESPPSDVFAQLKEDYENAQRDFELQKRKVVKLLERFNEQDAREVEGAGWSERGKALLDAMIKKLDDTYDVSKLDAKNQERFEKTKIDYAEATAKLAEIEKKASSMKDSVANTMTSSVETLAHGSVIGATVIATTESWDKENEEYQVASVVVWSPKLKASAEAMLTGQVESLKPKAGRTLSAWLKKQDLGSLIGPRQLIDETGSRWFIGVYAEEYTGSSARKRSAKGRAEIYAKKEAAMAIFADLETRKSAMTAVQTRNVDLNTSTTDIAKSFGESTSQSIEKMNISGGSTIMRREVTHPLTGTKMYAVVFAVSANAAKDAIKMEKNNYAAAMNIEKYQSKRRGEKSGLDKALSESKDNSKEYNEGKSGAYSDVYSVSDKQNVANKKSQKQVLKTGVQKTKTGSGTMINAEAIDDDDF